jgi:diacylglycerol kinase family enzyme
LAKAAASGVDIVSAYGGGSTQMGITNILLGTGVLLAIPPSGPVNALAPKQGTSLKLHEGSELIVSSKLRAIVLPNNFSIRFAMIPITTWTLQF